MAVIAYESAAPGAQAPARRESWLMRLFNAFAEARMKQAYREIARHRHLLPQELEEAAAARIGERTEDELPFIR
jgi:hypothetical protein